MSNELVSGNLSQEWAQKLADAAKEQAATEKPTGNFFSTKGGILTWNNMALPGNKMEVIVLAAMHENVYYSMKFDATNLASPLCYAYSPDGTAMVPHVEVEQQQSPTCGQCRHLKWGSGDNGRGKACRELRRLALLPASAAQSPEAAAAATVGLLRIPIMSVKNWSAYMNGLTTKQLPTFAVICEVSVVPDQKSMFTVQFRPVRAVDDVAVLATIAGRIPQERANMQTPYPKRLQQGQAPAAQPPQPPQQPGVPPPPPAAFGAATPIKF